jgi:hypothetical protein
MNDVEERARRLLDGVRTQHDPSSADSARVRARLAARVRAEPLLIAPTPAAQAAIGPLGRLLVALGVGAGAGLAAGLYLAPGLAPTAPTTARATAPVPSAPAAFAPVSDAASRDGASAASVSASPDSKALVTPPSAASLRGPSSVTSARTSRARANAAAAAATPPAAVTPLKAELDGLRRAQELLYQGQPAWALARLAELDRAGVSSALLEERWATRTLAQCSLGGDERALSEAFEKRYPGSAHLEQVRASCRRSFRSGAPAQNSTSGQTEPGRERHE